MIDLTTEKCFGKKRKYCIAYYIAVLNKVKKQYNGVAIRMTELKGQSMVSHHSIDEAVNYVHRVAL